MARKPVQSTGSAGAAGAGVIDRRPQAEDQRKLIEAISRSPRVVRQAVQVSGTTDAAAPVLQRLAIADMPFPNLTSRLSLSIKKSGAGTTGVYFAVEGGERIVVKFLSPEEAFRAKVADAFMAEGTELETPGSRILAPGTPGNISIRAAVRAHKDLDPPRVNVKLKTDVDADTTGVKAVALMEHVDQVSLRELVQGRPGQAPADERARLVQALSHPNVAREFAKVMVVDAIVGNQDRFLKDPLHTQRVLEDPANISNVFLTPGLNGAVALDNMVERAERRENAAEALNESRTRIVRYLGQANIGAQVAMTIVKSCLLDAHELTPATFPGVGFRALTGPMALALVPVEAILAANLTQSIRAEIATVGGRLKGRRQQIKTAYDTAGVQAGIAAPAAEVDYDALRARAKMLKTLRAAPNEPAAEAAAITHLTHKRDKAAGRLPRQRALAKIAGLLSRHDDE